MSLRTSSEAQGRGQWAGTRVESACVSRSPVLLSFLSGTYSLKCYHCSIINSFECRRVTICDYEVRRCLTVSIRKYLLVFPTPCELVTCLSTFRGQSQSVFSLHSVDGPGLLCPHPESMLSGARLSPGQSSVSRPADTCPVRCGGRGHNSTGPQRLGVQPTLKASTLLSPWPCKQMSQSGQAVPGDQLILVSARASS